MATIRFIRIRFSANLLQDGLSDSKSVTTVTKIIQKEFLMTMKKSFLLVAFAVLLGGGGGGSLFAQANSKNNWLSGELSIIGAGATYERMLSQNFSLGVNVYWTSLFLIFNDLGTNVIGRWYPWGGNFYTELGLGFGTHTALGSGDGDAMFSVAAVNGVALVPGIGWKIDVGQPGGFFIEPIIQLPITLGGTVENKFGSGVGFRAAFGMGVSF
jgi:hypothetical protein